MWVLEGLGDVEGWADEYIHSAMGGISFFQMIYFTFITISTVGGRLLLTLSISTSDFPASLVFPI